MRNVLNFIIRFHFFFLFLLLETIAMFMVVRNHNHQRTYFLHSANAIAGFYYQRIDNIFSYLSLQQVNDQLARENASMLNMSAYAFMAKDTSEYVANDTLYARKFSFLKARVINNSVMSRNNYLTINMGSRNGIEKDMGVITPEGVVGIVNNVSRNFATIISLLHKDMQISVSLKKNNHIGTLVWEGGDYRKAAMLYIPTHVELSPGDTIITSGYSRMFPEGVLVGTIEAFDIRRGENFYTADIQLSLDFNKLKYVYVVNDLMGEELEIIEAINR
jgi:rod shape-determining protein MreC